MAEQRVNYDITATDKTRQAVESVKRSFKEVESAAFGLRAALGGVAVLAVAQTLSAAAKAAAEAEVASNRLTAVLRATGNAAGYTKKQIDDMADAMAGDTIFDDEGIRNAAATMLKFGTIQGEVFERGMKLAADYASFMGTDIQDAAQAIGKALQSPDEGVTSLERQIGKLDYTQKQNIETFLAQGKVMDAQRVILDALDKKIGGTAALMNTGLNGSIKGVKKNFDELLETIGNITRTPTESFLGFVNDSLKDMKRIIESGDWVAALKFIMGFRGMDVKELPGKAVSGIIRGGPGDPAIAAQKAMDEANAEARKKASDKGKSERDRLSRERTVDAERTARMEVEAEEQAAKDATEAWTLYGASRQRLVQEEADAEARARQAVFDMIDREQEEAIQQTQQYLDALKEGGKDADDVFRDLGFTMSSAAEEAIMDFTNLRGVLQGVLKDIAQIAFRQTVTKPLGTAIATGMEGIFKGGIGKLGNIFEGTQAPAPVSDAVLARANGGPFDAGDLMLVGERGPELVRFGSGGSVVSNEDLRGMMGGGGGGSVGGRSVSVTQHFAIDARGTDPAVIGRLQQAMATIGGRLATLQSGQANSWR